jgi:hypothetical protein
MRKLNTSAITTSIAMPVKSGTLDHIQNAYTEAIAEAVKALAGSNYNGGTMYILNGLINTGTFPNYNISAGSVFYNGEVYLVDAANFTLAGAQVAVCKIVTTQFTGVNADSVQFNDGVPRNVHDIRKVQVMADLAGSGISNYVDGQRINANRPDVSITSGAGISIGGAFPNFSVTNTSPALPSPVLYYRKVFLGDLNTDPGDGYTTRLAGSTNGLTAYQHNWPIDLSGAGSILPVLQIGNQGHTDWGGFNDNFMCVHHLGYWDNSKMYFSIGTTASGNAQSLDLFYYILKLP